MEQNFRNKMAELRHKIDMKRRIAKEWCQEIGKVNEAAAALLQHFELTCPALWSNILYLVFYTFILYTLVFCIFPFVVLYLCICKGEWIFSCGTAAFGAALACLVQHFQPDPAPCTLLFFSTFYSTFKNFSSTFHFHFLQLLQQLFQPDPAPCTLLSFLLNFPLPQKLLVRLSLYFYYFVLSLIFTTTVLNLHFLSPACLHFDISLSKCIQAHKWWFTRFVATFFVLYLFLILYA